MPSETLSTFDYALIFAYFIVLIFMGIYYSKKQSPFGGYSVVK